MRPDGWLSYILDAPPCSCAAVPELQVLPRDISEDELSQVMLENLRGLGLPRRQSEGCLHCHVGDMERPSDTWNWASDAKPEKVKARAMMVMVNEINRDHLAKLEARVDPPVTVRCYTCHAGRTDPRSLEDVLRVAYQDCGIDSIVTRYHELRERYFGGDAYHFRVGVLAGMAFELAGSGAFDDAIALAQLNADVNPSVPAARRMWMQLRLARTAQQSGIDGALAEFDQMPTSEAVDPALLDGLGWGMYRQDQQEEALAVFRHNHQQFPDDYIPNESLADALWLQGKREAAIQMFEAWLSSSTPTMPWQGAVSGRSGASGRALAPPPIR